jgi:hypothetical protein
MGEYLSAYHLGVCVFRSVFTHAAFAFKNFSAHTFFGTYHGIRAIAFLDQSRQTPFQKLVI